MSSAYQYKISLWSAILININIMLGTGIFINTGPLANRAGALGAVGYLVIGVLMFPLVLSMAQLLRIHPAGGFYVFAQKEINPCMGFVSAWSYFIGKLASATLMIHIAVLLFQSIFSGVVQRPLLWDVAIITLFMLLNMYNIKTNSIIQSLFMGMKTVPIFVGIAVGVYLCKGIPSVGFHDISGIYATLPLVLYATVGFEAACSLSSHIVDAQKNGPRAIIISYCVVIITAFLYQMMMYSSLGVSLATMLDYRLLFPTLLASVIPSYHAVQEVAKLVLHMAIATSALGGAYGIMFSNSWNLYTLAQHGHILGSCWLKELNRHAVAWRCVLVEGIICLLYVVIARGAQIPLQQLGALGCVIAYTLSALALLYASRVGVRNSYFFIALLGLGNCALLTLNCIYNVILNGFFSFMLFGALFVVGIGMFWYTGLTRCEKLRV